jgi:hypothetical protein
MDDMQKIEQRVRVGKDAATRAIGATLPGADHIGALALGLLPASYVIIDHLPPDLEEAGQTRVIQRVLASLIVIIRSQGTVLSRAEREEIRYQDELKATVDLTFDLAFSDLLRGIIKQAIAVVEAHHPD